MHVQHVGAAWQRDPHWKLPKYRVTLGVQRFDATVDRPLFSPALARRGGRLTQTLIAAVGASVSSRSSHTIAPIRSNISRASTSSGAASSIRPSLWSQTP